MSRRMSCSLTTDAVRNRTKTVTRRRLGTWRTLAAGDRLTLVEKAMGLPKGATQVVLAEVEVVDVRDVPLWPMTFDEVVREGLANPDDVLPGMDPEAFARFWLESHGYGSLGSRWQFEAELTYVRRIEWRYVQ